MVFVILSESEESRGFTSFEFLREEVPEPKTRSFAEFILSRETRSFALLRMTGGEGIRMTGERLRMI
jgi:hypothetical protein